MGKGIPWITCLLAGHASVLSRLSRHILADSFRARPALTHTFRQTWHTRQGLGHINYPYVRGSTPLCHSVATLHKYGTLSTEYLDAQRHGPKSTTTAGRTRSGYLSGVTGYPYTNTNGSTGAPNYGGIDDPFGGGGSPGGTYYDLGTTSERSGDDDRRPDLIARSLGVPVGGAARDGTADCGFGEGWIPQPHLTLGVY